MDFSLVSSSPLWLAFTGTCFTWLMTGLGASTVFLFKTMDSRKLHVTLGFAGGTTYKYFPSDETKAQGCSSLRR